MVPVLLTALRSLKAIPTKAIRILRMYFFKTQPYIYAIKKLRINGERTQVTKQTFIPRLGENVFMCL